MEGAAKNMAAEAPHNDFDKYLAETKDNWNRQLGKIVTTDDNPPAPKMILCKFNYTTMKNLESAEKKAMSLMSSSVMASGTEICTMKLLQNGTCTVLSLIHI